MRHRVRAFGVVLLLAFTGLGVVNGATEPARAALSAGSQLSGEVVPPSVQTTVTSADVPSRAGWYRRPVTVSFTCTPGSAPLVTPCPGPFRYTASGESAGELFVVEAADGGVADAMTPVIRLDRVEPTIRVARARAAVSDPGRSMRCRATDRHSGVKKCTVRARRVTTGGGASRLEYRVIAVDQAGNRARIQGSFRLAR